MTLRHPPGYKQELKSAVARSQVCKKSTITALMATPPDRRRQDREPTHGLPGELHQELKNRGAAGAASVSQLLFRWFTGFVGLP